VGTAFAVEIGEEAVDVLVIEGRVAVADAVAQNSPDAPTPDATLVDAGQRLVVDSAGQAPRTEAQPASESETTRRLAWRVPRELSETARTVTPMKSADD
jgi:ferric-dicitrate binding protein FerR (iron transport regulator)